MGECKTCFGNGFIVIGAISDPCPDCWGSGRDDSDDDDAEDGEDADEDEDEDVERLRFACKHHTHRIHHDDLTVAACWDADRLELGRVGIDPEPSYFNTVTAIGLVRSGCLQKLRGLRMRRR